MKQIDWLVRVQRAPAVVRYCKKCRAGKAFVSSGVFRVNAQKKSLDVWLVYKCSQCDTSWNLPILSRVNPRSMPPELLAGFHGNSAGLAMQYALDFARIRRNGGEPGAPEIEVAGGEIALSEPARLRLAPQYPLEVKVSSILRARLGLSRDAYERLCDKRAIRCASGDNPKRCKLSGEVMIEIG